MSAADMLERARAEGIQFAVVEGKLMARGPDEAVASWAPVLRPHRAELLALLASEPVDWRALSMAYDAHHFSCPQCIAAGKGYGLRCGAGTALWAAYQARDLGKSATRTEEAQP